MSPDPKAPSPGFLAALRPQVARFPPFAQMGGGEVDQFLAHCEQRYYAAGEVLASPADGPVREIFLVREGAVTGRRGLADVDAAAFQYEAGDLFPLGAAVAGRPVTSTYSATDDTFVLVLPVAAMNELAAESRVFAEFLDRRVHRLLELSRVALQADYASRSLAEQSLETPLGELARRKPVTCGPGDSLRLALGRMQELGIGSILVAGEGAAPAGILTRHDVLGRVTLPQVPLDTPIGAVMVSPVHTLTVSHTAQDAALLMSRHGIRHVPVLRDGVLAGIVSERDLFAAQRLSLKGVGTALRRAPDIATLRALAGDIRQFARNLVGQGVQARQLTSLVSQLNDALTRRLLELLAPEHGVALDSMCWLALGSEGRGEQTIATDQDNALVLPDGSTAQQRQSALAFAHAANIVLDECGYPLCRGGIMAGEPACCLTLAEWRERFAHWIDHGAPQDLLNASIYFDLRALAGDATLANSLATGVIEAARRTPRFLKQLALNAIARSAPLNWHGGIDADPQGCVDLKLQGTAIYVDAARLYSLAHGIAVTGTRDRLEAAGRLMGLAPAEYGAWCTGFEFLQMLRLRVQIEERGASGNPNRLEVASLDDIDRRILREALRTASQLQQRMQLDYGR